MSEKSNISIKAATVEDSADPQFLPLRLKRCSSRSEWPLGKPHSITDKSYELQLWAV